MNKNTKNMYKHIVNKFCSHEQTKNPYDCPYSLIGDCSRLFTGEKIKVCWAFVCVVYFCGSWWFVCCVCVVCLFCLCGLFPCLWWFVFVFLWEIHLISFLFLRFVLFLFIYLFFFVLFYFCLFIYFSSFCFIFVYLFFFVLFGLFIC